MCVEEDFVCDYYDMKRENTNGRSDMRQLTRIQKVLDFCLQVLDNISCGCSVGVRLT